MIPDRPTHAAAFGAPSELPGLLRGRGRFRIVTQRALFRSYHKVGAGSPIFVAPGGKTTQIACSSARRVYALSYTPIYSFGAQSLERCGLNAQVVVGDAVDLCAQYGPFDRIVLIPPQRLGTLRRHPEIGYRYRLRSLNDSAKTQSGCLRQR